MGILRPKKTLKEPSVSNSDTCRNIKCNKITFSFWSIDDTLKRGNLLGTIRPFWLKTVESEERLKWINKMIGKKLLVRDLEAFAESTSEKLRTEESIYREEEREILLNDVRMNLGKLKI